MASLKQLSMDVVNEYFNTLTVDSLPPNLGSEIVRVQLARGNLSSKLLTLALQCRVTKLNLTSFMRSSLTKKELKLLRELGLYLEVIRIEALQDVVCHDLLCIFATYKKLRRFQFTHSNQFTDSVAKIIIVNNLNLEHFNVGHTRITDATLNLLGDLKHLKAVDVSYNIEVTDSGVLRMCEGLSQNKLEELRIDMCPIKNDTVARVMRNCKSLKHVSTDAPVHEMESRLTALALRNMTYFLPFDI